ncbi:GspE/PulE family protein [Neptuniibacter caesariensis]|uniref:Type II secretory pathway, ATPase n=1 Tax=Neptuniibacter caesariensis TaxID=207954 RepID=A0A7U8GRC0_NEPCE|nr:GspE/PulE family protein [Neptuniibacter caesariensis]EAR61212.1 type II secretory pathway, ATPase [Oceanospirillum sp. MED92] [Neptuniibacter caesariensis]
MAAPKMKIRIGDLLVQNGVISEQQLMEALDKQKQTRQKLGKALVTMGYVQEQQFLEFLSQQLNIPLVELTHYSFNQEDVLRLPETQARRFRALVLKEEPDHFLVGMSDPMDIFAFDELQRTLPKPIELAVVSESQLLQSMDLLYRKTSDIEDLADQLNEEIADDAFDLAALTATDEVDVPVVKLLKSLFEDAVQVGASDIHIEPDENVLRIRQRIDGVLHEHVMKEKRIASALVLRLKLMASLNISEKRLPQDGRFNISVSGHSVDVRISTLPIQFGESVVMRLLDQSGGIIGLEKVGLPQEMLPRLRKMINEPHGILLVTGPTGSGKTTTLYGALNELNSHEKKIITVEDPVEYRLPRINQVQVQPNIGLDFSTVLRATLRQDPDILLVGEIRDKETAEIALRAAMTGHFVLSTLHTNDAVSSAMRLTDIGIEGYLAASALNGILAQRLVRKICENCSQHYHPSGQEQLWLDERQLELGVDDIELKKGRGCTYCNNTGYKGRTGIFELLEINEPMADALRRDDSSAFTIAAKTDPHYKPLVYSALELAMKGITTLEEVFRVTEQLDESIYLDAPEASAQVETPSSGLELE